MKYITKKEIELKNPLVVGGFPGVGLIGSIAAYHIIKNLNLDFLGYFDSPDIPPIMTVEEGIIYPPIRVYGNENLVVIYSDIIVSPDLVYPLTEKIMEYIVDLDPKMIITLEGLASMKSEGIYAISSSNEVLELVEKEEIPILKLGMVGGIAGTLIIKSEDKNLPSMCLMAETVGLRPDPRGASNIIEVLNKLYDLKVNTEELIKEAEKIEEKLKQLTKEHMKLMSKPRAENPMYM
ncbi:MAG: uncharacterized protein PWP15_1514 [Methanothermococcus sp.]|uniref:proteasome assembly chaperone family protein n=1 Tax=Methanothermococcus TaxID=155862 RepID=UPI00037D4BD8|nr:MULTISPECIES: proteasome assembly chaperone family protein [Methanothermococcus]MDK2791005.1 uncharacterized protein [Methanothermococcus sp.]MDK2988316.1 uncharacterized protein [Methanothermococcus sp.]